MPRERAGTRGTERRDDEARTRYVEALADVLVPGGKYFMLCFSDRQPGDWGPRRVSEQELRATFGAGWAVESIEPARIETNLDEHVVVDAWLLSASRSRPAS